MAKRTTKIAPTMTFTFEGTPENLFNQLYNSHREESYLRGKIDGVMLGGHAVWEEQRRTTREALQGIFAVLAELLIASHPSEE